MVVIFVVVPVIKSEDMKSYQPLQRLIRLLILFFPALLYSPSFNLFMYFSLSALQTPNHYNYKTACRNFHTLPCHNSYETSC